MFKKVAFTMYPISDVARARKFCEERLVQRKGRRQRRRAAQNGCPGMDDRASIHGRDDRYSR